MPSARKRRSLSPAGTPRTAVHHANCHTHHALGVVGDRHRQATHRHVGVGHCSNRSAGRHPYQITHYPSCATAFEDRGAGSRRPGDRRAPARQCSGSSVEERQGGRSGRRSAVSSKPWRSSPVHASRHTVYPRGSPPSELASVGLRGSKRRRWRAAACPAFAGEG